MSLSSIFNNGLSGLLAAQAGVRVVSQNVSNLNTPGYVRAELNLEPQVLGGLSAGVDVVSVTRAVDQFLAAASLNAAASQGASGVRADILDRAQTAFGDPNSSSSLFSLMGATFASFSTLAADPTNTLLQSSTVSSIQNFLGALSNVGGQLTQLQSETQARLGDQAQAASQLLSQIASLNGQIVVARANGGDSTAAENAQSQLIDQLSGYVDVKVTQNDSGGVTVRTGAGALLVGDSAATISYAPGANGQNTLTLTDARGVSSSLEGVITSGSLAGLLQLRDQDLPQIAQALGQLAGATADALNAVHDNSTAVPAPTSLSGRDTGLLSTDRLGFTGKATIALTDANGNLLHTVAVDFSAGTLSVDGAGAASFGGANATVAQFVTGLNTALGANGSASFANGALTISATGTNGVVVQQDPATPSSRGGRGFAQFFGLNDLITRGQPLFFDTGFAATDAHGLTAGGAISFTVKDASGRDVADRTVSVAGTTWSDMLTALNASGTGLGAYGSFTLSSTGALTIAPASGYTVTVTSDTTARGNTGLSMSSLFGLDANAAAGRATSLGVASAIVADPSLIASAQPDLTQPLNTQVLEAGDNRGMVALAGVASANINFAAAGAMAAQTATLTNYAATLGGVVGQLASSADSAQTAAAAVASAASAQRSSAEGVNLDDELVKMTQYQQSYSASSRLIQAAMDMYDTLLSIK